MVKPEIVEGLREAVGRGEPLRKAMMSFFNSGYTKEEVEEAAIEMKKIQPVILPTVQSVAPGQPIQPNLVPQVQQTPFSQPPQFRPLPQFPAQTIQAVSDYGQKAKPISLVVTKFSY